MSTSIQVGIASLPQEVFPPFGKQTFFFEDMLRASPELAATAFFFSPLDWEAGKEVSGWQCLNGNWQQLSAPVPPLIYDRAFPSHPEQIEKIQVFRNWLRKEDIRVLNPLDLSELMVDKVSFHRFLERHEIPSLPAWGKREIEQGIWKGESVFLKPIRGAQGKGIFRLRPEGEQWLLNEAEGGSKKLSFGDCFELLEAKLSEGYFLQPEARIKPFQGRTWDIRVLIQNQGTQDYRISGYGVRLGPEGRITANLGLGGSALPLDDLSEFLHDTYDLPQWDLQAQLYDLSMSTAQALHAEFGAFCEAGLDLLLCAERGLLLLEGNARPSRWIFTAIGDVVEKRGEFPDYWRKVRLKTTGHPLQWAKLISG